LPERRSGRILAAATRRGSPEQSRKFYALDASEVISAKRRKIGDPAAGLPA
jgi:hypothetical protein